nr:hypothetical protein [Actinomycetota bacterium]
MRRLLAVSAAALVAVPAANAASIAVVPRNFSPLNGALAISGSVSDVRAVGVQLTTARGRVLGWLRTPEPTQVVSAYWDGTINGVRVRDGYYFVRLVSGREALATTPIRVDSVAPELTDVSADNGSTPFSGDTALLTTVTPNGDGLRDAARFRFRLDEPATVTLTISRTQNTLEAPLYTRTQSLGAGEHSFDWTPAAGLGPRTYLGQLTAVDRAANS